MFGIDWRILVIGLAILAIVGNWMNIFKFEDFFLAIGVFIALAYIIWVVFEQGKKYKLGYSE